MLRPGLTTLAATAARNTSKEMSRASIVLEGAPVRMRRYVFSEAFAAIAFAALARATGEERAAEEAGKTFAAYLRGSFEPDAMPAKSERPMKGLAPLMIAIVTAQELRANLGDVSVRGCTCSEWIDRCIAEIGIDFFKPEHEALARAWLLH